MKVIIAEDDVMLADFLAEGLVDLGHDVAGIACNVAEAVALARLHHPDVAIFDMQLGHGELGTDIADQLAASNDLDGIGVLYVTGEVERVVREARFGHGCLHKPYSLTTLQSALSIVDDIAHGKISSAPTPLGMQLLGLPSGAILPRGQGSVFIAST